MLFRHNVLVTSDYKLAIEALSVMQPLHAFVDNEADYERYTNCMTIANMTSQHVLVYYGSDVCLFKNEIYAKLENLGTTCYCWDSVMEKDYPNLVDMQRLEYENSGLQNHPLKLSLANY
jgi:hypothetical protein